MQEGDALPKGYSYVAWEALFAWWPTETCQEESAKMASHKSKVENTNLVGSTFLVNKMERVMLHSMQATPNLNGCGCTRG